MPNEITIPARRKAKLVFPKMINKNATRNEEVKIVTDKNLKGNWINDAGNTSHTGKLNSEAKNAVVKPTSNIRSVNLCFWSKFFLRAKSKTVAAKTAIAAGLIKL